MFAPSAHVIESTMLTKKCKPSLHISLGGSNDRFEFFIHGLRKNCLTRCRLDLCFIYHEVVCCVAGFKSDGWFPASCLFGLPRNKTNLPTRRTNLNRPEGTIGNFPTPKAFGAGKVGKKTSPERTEEMFPVSLVAPRQITANSNQPLRGWLISIAALRHRCNAREYQNITSPTNPTHSSRR